MVIVKTHTWKLFSLLQLLWEQSFTSMTLRVHDIAVEYEPRFRFAISVIQIGDITHCDHGPLGISKRRCDDLILTFILPFWTCVVLACIFGRLHATSFCPRKV